MGSGKEQPPEPNNFASLLRNDTIPHRPALAGKEVEVIRYRVYESGASGSTYDPVSRVVSHIAKSGDKRSNPHFDT